MANRIRGITIEIDGDTTKLTSSLSGLDGSLRKSTSTLKDINKLLKMDPGNVTLLKQKYDEMQRSIDNTKQRLDALKNAQKQMASEGKVGTAEYDALQREIIETEQKLKGLTKEYERFGSVSAQQVAAAGQKMQEVGGKITGVGEALMPVTAALGAVGAAGVAKFAEYDKTMSLVNATMGNSEDQAANLSKAIKEAAAQSVFGMSDAAEAALNFARAGLTAEEAAAAIAPAMNLAAGEGGNLEVVSRGLVGTINAFGASFDETARYADVLAAACNNSALDIDSLSEYMSNATAVFAAAGYSVEDLTLAMGLMANKNIDAATASTALKTGIGKLAAPMKAGAEALDKLGFSTGSAEDQAEKLATAQDKQKVASLKLDAAQKKLSETVTKYGEDSSQAASARAKLADAEVKASGATQAVNLLQQAANEGLSSYGELLVNSNGEMRGFEEVLWMLSEAFADLSEEEQIQAASAIFGKEQYSNWLALIQSSHSDVQELSAEIHGASLSLTDLDAQLSNSGLSISGMVEALEPLGISAETVTEALKSSGGDAEAFAATLWEAADAGVGADDIIEALGGNLNVLQEAMDNTRGTTDEMSEAMMSGFGGSMEALKSSVDVAATSLGEALAPMIMQVVEWLQHLVEWFNALSPAGQQTVAIIGLIVAAIGPLLIIIGTLISSVGQIMTLAPGLDMIGTKLMGGISTLGGALAKLWAVMLANPITIVIAAIAAIIAIFVVLWNKCDAFRNFWINLWDGIKDKAASAKDAVVNTFNSLKEKLSAGIQALKNLFNFSWSLPKIKLPHFSIQGSFSLSPPSVPHLAVDWYAKAMANGVILRQPTIFGAAGGKLLGGGEAGPEAVVGTGSLAEMVRAAVREANGEPRDITPLLMEMIALLRLLTSQSVYLDTGQLVGELAPAVNRQLGQEAYYGRRERINGR
jgi:phage-related minor tail protein